MAKIDVLREDITKLDEATLTKLIHKIRESRKIKKTPEKKTKAGSKRASNLLEVLKNMSPEEREAMIKSFLEEPEV